MRRRAILGLAVSAPLAGVVSDAHADVRLSRRGALIVLGVEGYDQWPRLATYFIQFRGVEPSGEFNRNTFRASNGNVFGDRPPAEYFVIEVRPGRYVAYRTIIDDGGARRVETTFCDGTIGFDVPADQVTYIGNYALSGRTGIVLRPPQIDAAAVALAGHPSLPQTMNVANVGPMAYPPSPDCR
ncbi:MAG TPA: hypothetical protein VJ748_02225, partial [Vitreimonas sp.]|jgi:hypothetical protein|nr:hypothetical protein [Vitreimonas sp.]